MQKSNVIRLRLTDLEKQDWQKAAGGARLTSAWIRAVCNAEAERLRHPLVELPAEQHEAIIEHAVALIPNAKPLIVEAAIAASVVGEEERREELSESSPSVPAAQPSAKRDSPSPKRVLTDEAASNLGLTTTGECVRWMHHRPGVYCGSCKKLMKK